MKVNIKLDNFKSLIGITTNVSIGMKRLTSLMSIQQLLKVQKSYYLIKKVQKSRFIVYIKQKIDSKAVKKDLNLNI